MLLRLGLALAVVVVSAQPEPAKGPSAATPSITVDLGLSPESRWAAASEQYKPGILSVLSFVKSRIPSSALPALEQLGNVLDDYIEAPYAAEMRGIATAVGVPVADILAMNLYYELTTACTSIVAAAPDGTVYHGRNLDYGVPGLAAVTVQAAFVRNSTVVYRAATYVGYVGVLTGMKPHAFSLSIDERDTNGTLWDNALEALFRRGRSVGFFLRSTLEAATTFGEALPLLQRTPLIAPSYLIIGGTRGQAAVVTRDRAAAVDTWALNATEGRWFLVETNYDHWLPVPSRDDRRTPATQAMRSLGAAKLSNATMASVLLAYPNLNSLTTYTAVMSASIDSWWVVEQNTGAR